MSTALKLTPTLRATGDERALSKAGKAHRPGQAARVLRKSVSVATTTFLVLAVTAFLALAIAPRVLGFQTLTMLTGSMAPLINPGDVVVTKPVPVEDLRVGDVITYSIPVEDRRVETHRITDVIANPDGSTAVRTKGDANNGADPWTATIAGAKVDRHVATVPYIGAAIRVLRQPLVLNTLMYGAPAVLVISMLASIWRKSPEPDAPKNASAAEALA